MRHSDRRTRTIGLLFEDVTDPFSAPLHRAVVEAARARRVHVLTYSLDESWRRRSRNGRPTACLVPTAGDQSYLAGIRGVPVVFVDRSPTCARPAARWCRPTRQGQPARSGT